MGGKQHDPPGGVFGQQVAEVYPLLGVKAGRRLVQYQNVRLTQQRLRNAQPTAHSAGITAQPGAAGFLQADKPQQFVNLGQRFVPAHPFKSRHIE